MNLKSFREDKLKMKKQSEFAELLGVEQSSLSRWEKDPTSVPFTVIQKIMEKTGATLEEITGWKKPIPKALDVDDKWKNVVVTNKTLIDYISSELKRLEISKDTREKYIDGLNIGLVSNIIKPKIGIVGRSDTGKSTLINALLGVEKMPTSWTPTTSIAVYIKHIDDRPSFIEEDVWIFSDNEGNETIWDEKKLSDEEYCRKWKIASGDIETLRSYGTRQGENYEKSAGSAVIFVDSPILKNCDIIDLPGFGTETEKDDDITFSISKKADIIIYLSQANAFMRIEDIRYLKQHINTLPIWEKKDENELKPLSNLFILASQAHVINNGNKEQISNVLETGCKNLLKSLPHDYFKERERISEYEYSKGGKSELSARFFAYTTDILDICEVFNASLSHIVEVLPMIINKKIKDFVKEYVKTNGHYLSLKIEKYEVLMEERNKYEALLEEINKNELKMISDNDRKKKEIIATIETFNKESKSDFSNYLAKTVNIDNVISLLDERGIQKKSEDIERFMSYFASLIEEKCNDILREKSEKFAKITDGYIRNYDIALSVFFDKSGIKSDFNPALFFAKALSNIAILGGLGVYLTSGLYVVTPLLVGVGVAGAMGFAPAIPMAIYAGPIFGPIGFAMALAGLSALFVINVLTSGWKKNVAKKIVESFDKERVLKKYQDGINEYWKQTTSAFKQASEELDKDWENYVKNLKSILDSYNVEEIKKQIEQLKKITGFFENIPL